MRHTARGEGRQFKPSGYDNPHVPLHCDTQKANAQRTAGGLATKRATQQPVEFDADRALEGLKRILGEVYPE